MSLANLSEIAEHHKVHRSTVQGWIKRGCPVVEQGGKGKQTILESEAVIKWRLDQAIKDVRGDEDDELSIEELRRRKLQFETEKAALELETEKGNVVHIDDVVKIVTDEAQAIKAILRNLPSRSAPRLTTVKKVTEIKKILGNEVEQCLRELSNRFIELD